MGFIRDIVKKADNSKEVAAELKENLNVLMNLAETKASLFQQEIEKDLVQGKTVDNLTIPITKVVDRRIEYRALTKDGTSDIINELAKSINTMISSGGSATSLVSGIASIASNALNTIMGAGEGQEQVVKIYTVVADYPAIVRFDFAFWCRVVKAESIRTHMEKALSCVAYKSAVDITQLQFNDFLTLYGPILRAGLGSDMKKMKEMIQEAKEIYTMFTGNEPLKRSVALDMGSETHEDSSVLGEINESMFQSSEGRDYQNLSAPAVSISDEEALEIVKSSALNMKLSPLK